MKAIDQAGRILITGARGSIGALFLDALPRKTLERTVVIDLSKPKNLPKSVKFYKVDLTEPASDEKIAGILEREQVQTVIHTAIIWNPATPRSVGHEVDVIGTMHLLNACHQQQVEKVIVVSSTIVYGAKARNPNFLDESAPLYGGQSNRYLRDKVEVEEEIRAFRRRHPKCTVTVLRPCMVVGPRIHNFVTDLLAKPAIPSILGYDPLVQFVHETDLIRAMKLALRKSVHGDFNIVGTDVLPLSYVIKLAGRVNVPIIYSLARPVLALTWQMGLTEFPPHFLDFLRYLWVASGDKARAQFGFLPKYSSKEALQSYLGQERLRRVKLEAA